MLDRANPLDVSWHYIMEIPPPSFGWDDLRIPLWMLKGLWDIGNVGPLSNAFFEMYWNPGDWRPVKVGFLPRPWGLRIPNPLTNREDGAFFAPFRAERLANGTSLFKQGDYSRQPGDNSQIGMRFSGVFPNGLQMSHQLFLSALGRRRRHAVRAACAASPTRSRGQIRTQDLLARGTLPAEYITPYIHTVGLSANYFEGNWTQTIFRMETVYDFGLPMFDRDKQTTFAPILPGVTRKDYWKGMIAFDRPTWIRVPQQEDDLLHHRPVVRPPHHAQRGQPDRAARPADRRRTRACRSAAATSSRPAPIRAATATSATTSAAGSRW